MLRTVDGYVTAITVEATEEDIRGIVYIRARLCRKPCTKPLSTPMVA